MEEGVGDLFDHIEDLLDFSNGDDVLGLLPPLPAPVAADAGGGLLGGAGDDSLQCSSNQTPCDELDAVQLEWMSKIFEDSSDSFFLDLPSCDAMAGNAGGNNASSPVSVLEAKTIAGGGGGGGDSSSSSSSTSASYSNGGNDVSALRPPVSPPEAPPVPMIPARARSKRSRAAATFPPRPHLPIPYLPPSSDVFAVSDPESFGECCPLPPPPKKKKNAAAAADAAEGEESATPPPVRKCMHCGIQKTPQWRAGPMGPKTLCNACGVRYKSGRLFPEYRPAASPTFVPSLHSNSHKKVVEMRIKASQKAAAGPMSSSDGCDLLEYIRRKD